MDFLSELRAASAQLDASAMAPQNDLYFNGDIEKWRRLPIPYGCASPCAC